MALRTHGCVAYHSGAKRLVVFCPKKYDSVLFFRYSRAKEKVSIRACERRRFGLSPNLPYASIQNYGLPPLDEGFGSEQGFVRALHESYPWSSHFNGPAPRGAGSQRAVILAKVCAIQDSIVWSPKSSLISECRFVGYFRTGSTF